MQIYRKKFEDSSSAQEAAKSILASYIDRPLPPQVGLEEEDGEVWVSVVLEGEIPDLEQLLQATGYAQID